LSNYTCGLAYTSGIIHRSASITGKTRTVSGKKTIKLYNNISARNGELP